MSFGDAIQKRIDILRKREVDIEKALIETSRNATLLAVEAATEKTPPLSDDLAGTNTRSGELKQHWVRDSIMEPDVSGEEVKTVLANDMQYASYVNNGHKMDKHFVPGLVKNPYNGMLEKKDPSEGGIMVGTKTQYVPGIFACEAGIEIFESESKKELLRIAREAFRD